MNPADLLKIALLRWRTLLIVFLVTFTGLAYGVLNATRQQVLVRTAVQIGSTFANGKREALESADELARRAATFFSGPAVESLQSNGALSQTALTALLASSYNGFGTGILISSTVDGSAEGIALKYQDAIAKAIIADTSPLVEARRQQAHEANRRAAERTQNLTQQIAVNEKVVQRLESVVNDLMTQSENLGLDISKAYQSANQDFGSELKIREMRDQRISLNNLTDSARKERSNLVAQNSFLETDRDNSANAELQAHLEVELTRNSSVMYTTVTPTPNSSRLLRVIALAFVISVLVAFAAVGLLQAAGGAPRKSWER
ncbi:hypothetical protein ACVIIW_006869 [Bradyrhizobium sp. USDA 4449]